MEGFVKHKMYFDGRNAKKAPEKGGCQETGFPGTIMKKLFRKQLTVNVFFKVFVSLLFMVLV